MATPVPEVAPGAVGHAAYDSILRQLAAAEVGIVGPGLGRDSSTWRLVVDLALHARCPLVIDADGLNALAEAPRSKGKLAPKRVLTPHPGELSRLTGKTAEAINADRPAAARKAAKEWGATVVLKGAGTVVAEVDGAVSVVGAGNPGRALPQKDRLLADHLPGRGRNHNIARGEQFRHESASSSLLPFFSLSRSTRED